MPCQLYFPSQKKFGLEDDELPWMAVNRPLLLMRAMELTGVVLHETVDRTLANISNMLLVQSESLQYSLAFLKLAQNFIAQWPV